MRPLKFDKQAVDNLYEKWKDAEQKATDNMFTTATFNMLQDIPVNIRQKFPNSRSFSFACVIINGYNTVVVYKKIIPIAIVAEWGTHINPLAQYDRWSIRNIFNTDWILSDTCRFFSAPRYVYPV